jgi:hypothetical protein
LDSDVVASVDAPLTARDVSVPVLVREDVTILEGSVVPVRLEAANVPAKLVAVTDPAMVALPDRNRLRHRVAVTPTSYVAVADGRMFDAMAAKYPALRYEISCHADPLSYHSFTLPVSVVNHFRPTVPAAGRAASVDD